MQRDIELMRRILLAIQAAPKKTLDTPPVIAGFDDTVVVSHLEMLEEAGLVETRSFISQPHAEIKLTDGGRTVLQVEHDGVGDLSEFI
jgi:hypothetical protein